MSGGVGAVVSESITSLLILNPRDKTPLSRLPNRPPTGSDVIPRLANRQIIRNTAKLKTRKTLAKFSLSFIAGPAC